MKKLSLTVRREVSENNEEVYRIVGFSALSKEELPQKYLAGSGPAVYFCQGLDRLWVKSHLPNLSIGDFISKEKYEEYKEFFAAAAANLRGIRRERAEMMMSWHGEICVVFHG